MADRKWMEIVVDINDADEVRTEDIAAAVAPTGAQLRPGQVVIWVTLPHVAETLIAVRDSAAKFDIPSNAVRAQPAAAEATWRDAWKRYFKVNRVTDRIVIVPSWESYTPMSTDVVIDLDPGLAFGTGTHASTQLCLRALDTMATHGDAVSRFYDLGTGSGILAIAAAKLWPTATGIATDIDPLAVDAARANAAHNHVDTRVTCSDTDLADVSEAFSLVLANIRATVHLEHRELIAARVKPSGTLVLSGILSNAVSQVAAAYVDAGFTLTHIDRSKFDPAWSAAWLTA